LTLQFYNPAIFSVLDIYFVKSAAGPSEMKLEIFPFFFLEFDNFD